MTGTEAQRDKGTEKAGSTSQHIIFEAFFLVTAVFAIAFYGQNTRAMSLLILLNISARFFLLGHKNDWIFFLIGVIGGGGNDVLSMTKGVYYYTPPHELSVPIPLWMLLFWGHIFVFFRHLFKLPAFQTDVSHGRTWKMDARLAADIATYLLLRIIIYTFVHSEPVPTIAYAVIILARLLLIPPGKNDLKLLCAVMVMGPLYEAVLIKIGLYVYYNPVFLGMPAWLLMYWAFMIPIFTKGIFARLEASLRNA